MGNCVKRFC